MTAQLALLSAGVVAPLLYFATDVMAGIRWEGYSFRDQTISELNAIGGADKSAHHHPRARRLCAPGRVRQGSLEIGSSESGAARGRRRVGGVRCPGAVGGALRFDARPGGERSLTDTMHLVDGAFAVLLLVAAIGFGTTLFGKRYRIYSIATILVLLAFGAWAAMDGPAVAKDLPTPWVGVKERISVYSYQLWLVVLAIALLRQQPARQSAILRSNELSPS